MNFVAVEKNSAKNIEKQAIEIVERKGLGHPDYMADSIAENFSVNLSKYYIEHFQKILHHNVDKLEIIGGETQPSFNGGRIIKPITVLFSGRATGVVDGKTVPLREIAENSAKQWIKNNIRFLDSDKIRYLFETNNGSVNLIDAFQRGGKPGSNDTSFAVGYYPFSVLENIVLKTENYLNDNNESLLNSLREINSRIDELMKNRASLIRQKDSLIYSITRKIGESVRDNISREILLNYLELLDVEEVSKKLSIPVYYVNDVVSKFFNL